MLRGSRSLKHFIIFLIFLNNLEDRVDVNKLELWDHGRYAGVQLQNFRLHHSYNVIETTVRVPDINSQVLFEYTVLLRKKVIL